MHVVICSYVVSIAIYLYICMLSSYIAIASYMYTVAVLQIANLQHVFDICHKIALYSYVRV